MKTELENLLNLISKEYYIDYYLIKFKIVSGVNLSNRQKLFENTIQKYRYYHPDFQYQRIKPIKEYLLNMVLNGDIS